MEEDGTFCLSVKELEALAYWQKRRRKSLRTSFRG
jgi:hypothetical protein